MSRGLSEKQEAALVKLGAAISEFTDVWYEDESLFVTDWVVVTHGQSIELAQEDMSRTSLFTPRGQKWPMTLGMMQIAMDDVEDE